MTGSERALLDRYHAVRQFSETICEPLEIEDYVVQSMPDASPAKWHLAHTSWFFETFVLETLVPNYKAFHPQFRMLFNSYYNAIGAKHCRPKRGFISRPTVMETYAYRHFIDEQMALLLDGEVSVELATLVTLGLHHEQQHQELMLTDIKHVLSQNPLHPTYRPRIHAAEAFVPPMRWANVAEGIHCIGHAGDGFCFDNELPRHRELVPAFAIADRLVTNGEYSAFIRDDGYSRPDLWLSTGWDMVKTQCWDSPLYWERMDEATFEWLGGSPRSTDVRQLGTGIDETDTEQWYSRTLSGFRTVDASEPVCHVSYYEADAFARWAGCRLPSEAEWEIAASGLAVDGNFAEHGVLHPSSVQIPGDGDNFGAALSSGGVEGINASGIDRETFSGAIEPGNVGIKQMYGDAWEWTRSAYLPYPGYAPAAGALGEYNGKFMCNQFVLRGGSCATPQSHIRASYRNFFPPDARWQFSGIRLAKDL